MFIQTASSFTLSENKYERSLNTFRLCFYLITFQDVQFSIFPLWRSSGAVCYGRALMHSDGRHGLDPVVPQCEQPLHTWVLEVIARIDRYS